MITGYQALRKLLKVGRETGLPVVLEFKFSKTRMYRDSQGLPRPIPSAPVVTGQMQQVPTGFGDGVGSYVLGSSQYGVIEFHPSEVVRASMTLEPNA